MPIIYKQVNAWNSDTTRDEDTIIGDDADLINEDGDGNELLSSFFFGDSELIDQPYNTAEVASDINVKLPHQVTIEAFQKAVVPITTRVKRTANATSRVALTAIVDRNDEI